jgi:hypothetical protein
MPRPKSLFEIASSAVRKQARKNFRASQLGKAISAAKRPSAFGRAVEDFRRQQNVFGAGRYQRDVARYGLYGMAMGAVNSLLGALGPFGKAIAERIGRKRPADQLQTAADLLRSYGMEILSPDVQWGGYARGERAARELLERAGYRVSPSGEVEKQLALPERKSSSIPAGLTSTDEQEEQSGEDLMPRVSPVVRTPGSSNVYSFQYNFENSTLYVRYQAHSVNSSAVSVKNTHGLGRVKGTLGHTVGGKTGGPGPMYAYYDVPKRVFERLARAQSAGRAVWDDLRIRGTAYGHQYSYGLVDAQEVQTDEGKGFYVPRKITAGGYRQRSFAPGEGAGRGYALSSLPREDRNFRGRPDAPNRGRAFNAQPFRGRGS